MRIQSGCGIQIDDTIAFFENINIPIFLVPLAINLPNRYNYDTSHQVLKILHSQNQRYRTEAPTFKMAENPTQYLRFRTCTVC